MLLNRSGRAITSLVYEAVKRNDMNRSLDEPTTYRIDELPRASYVLLGEADPRPQRSTAFTLTRVDWATEDAWSGRRHFKVITPRSVGVHLESLSLTEVDTRPTAVHASSS